MFIKLGIIVGIVILGGMIFSTEIGNIFPTTSATVFDSLIDDVANFGSKASDSVDQRIDESIDKIVDKTSNSITNEISEAGDNIANEISEAKKSSQKTITEEISNFNPIEAITNIFTGSSGSSSTTSSSTTSSSTTSPITYETLSLSTKQQSDDNILLQYSDSSGKTQSVNVVIRTEQKEIFSGTFFTSMFETTVNDASGIPYYVDMVVEHEDYGTISSSVFNTGDDSDTKINGIFSQQ
jgi:predicted PurR-regulated permease PerM